MDFARARFRAANMQKLSKKEYWDSQYAAKASGDNGRPGTGGLPSLIRRLVASGPLRCLQPYRTYRLWEAIYETHLPKAPGAKVVEIGSAPGHHLVRLNRRYGYDPYGIEYADAGVRLNRRVFADSGLDPDHVIHSDFFAGDVLERYRGFFDVVVSRGFIEHFSEPVDVIDRHLALLKPGGTLVVSVPNLRGFNWLCTRFSDPRALAMHNLRIMDRRVFLSLFSRPGLQRIFCGYYGTFDLVYAGASRRGLRKLLAIWAYGTQLLINAMLRLLFGARGAEGATFSPLLMYIGRKRDPDTRSQR